MKTTFILGAGASHPYSFPLGFGLKKSLLRQTSNGRVKERLKEQGYDGVIDEFREILRYGSYETIDQLLGTKHKFRGIGSYLIAETILNHENHENLFPAKDWYSNLFMKLDIVSRDITSREVAFISLNYDRSLEHFLEKAIEYQLRDEDVSSAKGKLREIEIIHAHGSVGAYPQIPYGSPLVNSVDIAKAAENIKIVSDNLSDSHDFQSARKCILDSNQIVFFGFAYHPSTLNALFDGISRFDTYSMTGSAYQLGEGRLLAVKEFFGDSIDLIQNTTDKIIDGLEF